MIVKTINDERFKTKMDSAIISKTELEDVFNFNARFLVSLILNPIQTGRGAFDANQDLNPLLLASDCVYSVPTS